jgi:hypothetical protein
MPFDSLEGRVRLGPGFRLTHRPEVPAASRTTGATTNLEVMRSRAFRMSSMPCWACLQLRMSACAGLSRILPEVGRSPLVSAGQPFIS